MTTTDPVLAKFRAALDALYGDRIEREALESLFERDTKCTDIIKWKDLYETLERAIDECEHVANVIESIVLKHN